MVFYVIGNLCPDGAQVCLFGHPQRRWLGGRDVHS
jgi:hypothetical protein